MPPPPKQKGRIQIKIMGLPGMLPSASPKHGATPAPKTPPRSPAFKLLSPKLTPKLAPLEPLDEIPSLEEEVARRRKRAASDSDSASDEDSSDEEERAAALHETIDTFKHQMHQIYMASKAAEEQVGRLASRAKEEAAEVQVQPLRPRAATSAWLAARADRGAPAEPSLAEFMELCLDAAESQDLETRTITFSAEDAAVLTGGQRRVSVFELLRLVPRLFI
jgi:hypothetical protein